MRKRGVLGRDLFLLFAALLLGFSSIGTEAAEEWKSTYAGAPTARIAHTAIWTGTRMIVWGGDDGITDLNTGARYDPVADTWAPTSTTGAPAGRNRHTAVWTGTKMIVWGGFNSSGGYLNTGGRYNPATDTWVSTSTTGGPTARYEHTAVWTGTKMIVW